MSWFAFVTLSCYTSYINDLLIFRKKKKKNQDIIDATCFQAIIIHWNFNLCNQLISNDASKVNNELNWVFQLLGLKMSSTFTFQTLASSNNRSILKEDQS